MMENIGTFCKLIRVIDTTKTTEDSHILFRKKQSLTNINQVPSLRKMLES